MLQSQSRYETSHSTYANQSSDGRRSFTRLYRSVPFPTQARCEGQENSSLIQLGNRGMRRLRKQHFWSIDRKCVGSRNEKTGSIRMARIFSIAQGACAGGFSTVSRMEVQPLPGGRCRNCEQRIHGEDQPSTDSTLERDHTRFHVQPN